MATLVVDRMERPWRRGCARVQKSIDHWSKRAYALASFKLKELPCTLLRLLLVLPTHSPQRPSFPKFALDRIDTIFFSHVPVRGPIRPFAPETLLDLL
jgi:hypothetical protein